MKTLHLNLKKEYFDSIKSGEKLFEYRLNTKHWRHMIEDRKYDRVLFKCGYPRRDDESRIIARTWEGFELQTITHPHFGPDPVFVYAIRVGSPLELNPASLL